MAAKLFFLPYQSATINGIAQPGAKAYFYTTGTTTALPSYTTSALTITHAHPVVADSSGKFADIYLDSTITYRLVLKTRGGTTIADIDPYIPGTAPDAGSLQPYQDACEDAAVTAAAEADAAAASATAAAGSASTATAAELGVIEALGGAAISPVNLTAATRVALAAMATPSAIPAVLSESGREGLFVWSSANLSAKVTADPEQGVYVPPSSDTTGASGAWVRKYSGPLDVRWFGAVGDGVTDDYDAIQGAIDVSFALRTSSQGYGRGGPAVFIPATADDEYYCSQKLVIEHTMRLIFDNNHGFQGGGAALRFPASQGGILVKHDAVTGGATGTVIDNPFLIGGFTTTEGEYHGIEFQVKCRINNAFITDFQGDGIYTDTNGTGYNVNGFMLDNPLVLNCRTGIYLLGADTNAGTLVNPVCLGNRRYGIWSKLTLGNAYVGGDMSTNGALGIGGTIPYTMCSYSGNRYYVLPNQDVAASTNAPSGTTANNAYWGYFGAGGASTEFPAWVTGTQTFRAGGSARFEGSYEQNTLSSFYSEGDQAPIQVDPAAQMVALTDISGTVRCFDGTRYGGQIVGTGAGVTLRRSLTIGDVSGAAPSTANDSASIDLQGHFRMTRNAANAYDPNFYIDTTNAQASLVYQKNGTNKAQVQWDNSANVLLNQLFGSGEVWHYINGSLIQVVSSSGALVKTGGLGYMTGAGGTVTQLTSKSTAAPALNKVCGEVTMSNASLAAATIVSFTMANSAAGATDIVNVNHVSGGTLGAYTVNAVSGAGTITFYVRNNTAGALGEALVLRFAILKAVTA